MPNNIPPKLKKEIKSLLDDYGAQDEMTDEDNVNYLQEAVELLDKVLNLK